MKTAPTSPEPTQGEPHPAVRLAEIVCALLAAIAGPAWLWRFLPSGRAFWAHMHRMGQDFAALMHRLATNPLTPQVAPAILHSRRRRSPRTAELRPRHASNPRRARAAVRRARRGAVARPPVEHAPVAVLRRLYIRARIALRRRRWRNWRMSATTHHALFVTILQ